MINKTTSQSHRLYLPMLLASVLLSACNGGIKGTGGIIPPGTDAGIDSSVESSDHLDTGGDGLPAPTDGGGTGSVDGGTGGTDGTSDSGGGTDTGGSNEPQLVSPISGDRQFSNLDVVTSRSDAILQLVHTSSSINESIVLTANRADDNPATTPPVVIIDLPGLDFNTATSGYLSLAPELAGLQILTASRYAEAMLEPALWFLDDLDLVAGSASLMIVRDNLDTRQAEARLISSRPQPDSDAAANIRVLHAAPGLATRYPDLQLNLQDATDRTVATSTALDYAGFSSAYMSVREAGEYHWQLVNAATGATFFDSRDTSTPLLLQPGSVVSLVLRDDPLDDATIVRGLVVDEHIIEEGL